MLPVQKQAPFSEPRQTATALSAMAYMETGRCDHSQHLLATSFPLPFPKENPRESEGNPASETRPGSKLKMWQLTES